MLAVLKLVGVAGIEGVADAEWSLIVHLHLRGITVLLVVDRRERDLVLAHAGGLHTLELLDKLLVLVLLPHFVDGLHALLHAILHVIIMIMRIHATLEANEGRWHLLHRPRVRDFALPVVDELIGLDLYRLGWPVVVRRGLLG